MKAGGWKEVIQAVAANPRAIGYVDAEHVDPARVKAVLMLP